MNFTLEQTDQIRLSAVRILSANAQTGSFALSTRDLLQMIRADGFSRLEEAYLSAQLKYLEGKSLIARASKAITPAIPLWEVTSAGQDFYEAQQR